MIVNGIDICKKCGSEKTGRCKVCKARRTKAWREANPERVKARTKAWREANPERVKARTKAWYEANPERVKARTKAWREANPERARAQNKAWYEANPERVKARNKVWHENNLARGRARGLLNAATRRQIERGLTIDQVTFLMTQSCYYCAFAPDLTQRQTNGLDRINSDLGYTHENVVVCCKWCNYAKSTLTVEQFRDHTTRLYKTMQRKKWVVSPISVTAPPTPGETTSTNPSTPVVYK